MGTKGLFDLGKEPYEKSFVVDTNVLIDDPNSLFKFGKGNLVILTSFILLELDKFKTEMSLRGHSSRKIIKNLDLLIRNDVSGLVGSESCNFVYMRTSHVPAILLRMEEGNDVLVTSELPHSDKSVDLRLIEFCKGLSLSSPDKQISLVTRDTALRVMASARGIHNEDYKNARVSSSDIYKGHKKVVLNNISQEDEILKALWKREGGVTPIIHNDLEAAADSADIKKGEYFTLDIPLWFNTEFVVRRITDMFFNIINPNTKAFGIHARNPEQVMIMDAILDPDVKLVTISGLAGSGKTLMTAACALEMIVHQNKFSRMIVTRPIVSVGKDLGFLPGNLAEKLDPWMAPFKDALDVIFNSKDQSKKKPPTDQLESLKTFNWIEVQSISHIRGRSIQDAIIFIDEAQNATQHELKTIISRAGENTKVILCGDPWQIDSPQMDAYSNGLAHVINRIKGYSGDEFNVLDFAHINLRAGERSQLSAFAAKVL